MDSKSGHPPGTREQFTYLQMMQMYGPPAVHSCLECKRVEVQRYPDKVRCTTCEWVQGVSKHLGYPSDRYPQIVIDLLMRDVLHHQDDFRFTRAIADLVDGATA